MSYLQEVEHSWPTSSSVKEVCDHSPPSDDLTHYLYSIDGRARVIPALTALAAAAAAATARYSVAAAAAAAAAAARPTQLRLDVRRRRAS